MFSYSVIKHFVWRMLPCLMAEWTWIRITDKYNLYFRMASAEEHIWCWLIFKAVIWWYWYHCATKIHGGGQGQVIRCNEFSLCYCFISDIVMKVFVMLMNLAFLMLPCFVVLKMRLLCCLMRWGFQYLFMKLFTVLFSLAMHQNTWFAHFATDRLYGYKNRFFHDTGMCFLVILSFKYHSFL